MRKHTINTFKRYHVWIGGRKPLKQAFETLAECFALVRETGKTGERARVFDALPYSMTRTLHPVYDSAQKRNAFEDSKGGRDFDDHAFPGGAQGARR